MTMNAQGKFTCRNSIGEPGRSRSQDCLVKIALMQEVFGH